MGQKYSAEYKEDVVKLADEIGVRAACEQLGLSTKTAVSYTHLIWSKILSASPSGCFRRTLTTKMKYGAKNNVFDPHSWLV